MQNRLIPGVDGPYYLIQVRSLLTSGALAYDDPPLTFYLLSLFSLLLGDLSLGVKVGVSLFCALTTIPAFFLMKRVGKGNAAGFIAMLLIVFSAPHIRMLTDFMKNAVGMCWLLAFLYYLHDLAVSGFKKNSVILAAVFLVLTGLTHILDFGVALLLLAFYTLMVVLFRVNRRSFFKSVSILSLILGVFVFVAATFFSPLFSDFSKIFSFLSDLQRSPTPISPGGPSPPPPPPGELGEWPSPPALGGPRPGLPAPWSGADILGGWGVILLVLSVGALLFLYVWKRKETEALLLLTVTTVVGIILSFPLIPYEWLWRFLLMFVLPTAILLSFGFSTLWRLIQRLDPKRFSFDSRLALDVGSIFLVAICVLFFVGQSVSYANRIRPTISYAGYLDLVDMKNHIPEDAILLPPRQHGMHYWVQYVEDVPLLGGGNRISSALWQSYSHVLCLFPKGQNPGLPLRTIFVGRIFVLAEVQKMGI